MPAMCFHVGRPVVDDREGESEKSGRKQPADEAGEESDKGRKEIIFDGVMGERGKEVSAEHAGQGEGDDAREKDCDPDSGEARHEVGTGFFDLVNGVEGILNCRNADRGRPDGGNEAEGEFSG